MFQSTSFSRRKTLYLQGSDTLLSFQSTSFLRRKTKYTIDGEERSSFNPLPSHEGRHNCTATYLTRGMFQSTSFSRRKTSPCKNCKYDTSVSIHFLLTKEDVIPIYFPYCLFVSIHFLLTKEDMEKLQK